MGDVATAARQRGPGGACLALALAGCTPMPELDAEGRRVRVGSELVDQVCAGTVARLDHELDTIEARLGVAEPRELLDLYVITPEQLERSCPDALACYQGPLDRVLLTAESFEVSTTHELTHAVMWHSRAAWAPDFFHEGIATAIERPVCAAAADLVEVDPTVDELLSAGRGYDHLKERNYAAGELVAWLLESRGPGAVLSFMAALPREARPQQIRATYLSHFGRSIDDDMFAHSRPWRPEQLNELDDYGCDAPQIGPPGQSRRFRLQATLDCDSPRVVNDFRRPGWGYVEWTVVIDDPDLIDFYRIEGELPDGTVLEYRECECDERHHLGPDDEWLDHGGYEGFRFARPVSLRWSGPLDSAPLDIELVGRCSPSLQDCPEGLVCDYGRRCRPVGPKLGSLGQPCEDELGYTPVSCAPGLACVGDREVDGNLHGECVAPCGLDELVCAAGYRCDDYFDLCGESCDPELQDCAAGRTCMLTSQGGVCLPAGEIPLMQHCPMPAGWSTIHSCAPGLVCRSFDACKTPDPAIGCCVPMCDPTAAISDCTTPELPVCSAPKHAAFGGCTPG